MSNIDKLLKKTKGQFESWVENGEHSDQDIIDLFNYIKDVQGLKVSTLEQNVQNIINHFDSSEREGLKETPKRYIKFLSEFIKPKELDFNFTTFESEQYNEMIIEKELPFYSLCEHHLAPFFGKAVIGYIPNKRIVGLSKLPRALDFFANRFQNQERITTQLANFLMEKLEAQAVGVILEAEHLCVAMRGVKKQGAKTVTSCLLGEYFHNHACKSEFLKLGGVFGGGF